MRTDRKTYGRLYFLLTAFMAVWMLAMTGIGAAAAGSLRPPVAALTAASGDAIRNVDEEEPIVLTVEAKPADGGSLEYQWYSSPDDQIRNIRAIDYADGPTYVTPKTLGVVYYCCCITNTKDGLASNPIYTDMIRVEYYAAVDGMGMDGGPAYSMEIQSLPDKLEYAPGEVLDLTGLRVRVYTPEGYLDLQNGERLEVQTHAPSSPGEQTIVLRYEDAEQTFTITVREQAEGYPVLVSESPDCTLSLEDPEVVLQVTAKSPDGGALSYQWYESADPDPSTFSVIQNEMSASYTPPRQAGVQYYRCGVWNMKNGTRTGPAYSRVIRVEYRGDPSVPSAAEPVVPVETEAPAETEPTYTMTIERLPDRLEYYVGEKPDLTGLRVRIDGGAEPFYLENGEGLEMGTDLFNTTGEYTVWLRYGHVDKSFKVQVVKKPKPVETMIPETMKPEEPPVPETVKPAEPPAPETVKPAEPPAPETVKPAEPPVPETVKPAEPPAPETVKPEDPPAPETAKPAATSAPETMQPEEKPEEKPAETEAPDTSDDNWDKVFSAEEEEMKEAMKLPLWILIGCVGVLAVVMLVMVVVLSARSKKNKK